MKLTFWGASRQVSGSMYLLETDNNTKLLIDCGADMEKVDYNPDDYIGLFPFEPSLLNAVIITHAHIDHTGYLPNLIREGFEGKIICTQPTFALTKLLLEDSASLNMSKLRRINGENRRKKNRKNKETDSENTFKETQETKGLYLQKQVDEILEYFRIVPMQAKIKLNNEIFMTLLPAGHLLGAAHIILEIKEKGEIKKICFSGDIGRHNYPLLADPAEVPQVDYLICESTYGNRQHKDNRTPEEVIHQVIYDTCVTQNGRLIIPAFSVGRTQAMLYTLHKLRIAGKLPPIKIFADSPLALKSTWIYQKHISWLNEEAKNFAQTHHNLFDFENLIYVEDMKDSKKIAKSSESCIIISSSGMIQGGRIEHHVRMNLENPHATIFMIGFTAEGTLGHELIHGKKTIKGKKKDIPVKANVVGTDVFSGHADLEDLIKFAKYQSPQKLKKLFLVHGEYNSMLDLQKTFQQQGFENTFVPKRGESFEL
jgi:metallo-beta-lactamase family protein